MRKFKSFKILCLTLGAIVAVSSGTIVNAASVTKTLKAVYNNIAVSYNGQLKSLSTEPFMINGSVYVPLRAVGEIMGANLTWANNTVYITNATSSVSSEQELAAKNFQIASLTQQLEVAKKELETLKASNSNSSTGTSATGSNLNTTAINNTLKKIQDIYSSDYSIDWDFELKAVSNRLELGIFYNSRYDESDYNKLSESKRKQFVKNICYDIANNHADVEIRGKIEDSRNNTEKVSFRYSRTGALEYDESSTYSLSDFRKELERTYKKVNCGSFDLIVDSIDLNERSNKLTFTINTSLRPGSNDYRASWNSLSSSRQNDIEYFMEDIYDDLRHEYSGYDDITGLIKDSSLGTIAAYENERYKHYTVSTN